MNKYVKYDDTKWKERHTCSDMLDLLGCDCHAGGVSDSYHICYECSWQQERVNGIIDKLERIVEKTGNERQLKLYRKLSRHEKINVSMGGKSIIEGMTVCITREQFMRMCPAWSEVYATTVNKHREEA